MEKKKKEIDESGYAVSLTSKFDESAISRTVFALKSAEFVDTHAEACYLCTILAVMSIACPHNAETKARGT